MRAIYKSASVSGALLFLALFGTSICFSGHLIERGMNPGPEMGPILKAAFEAQLEGAFSDLEGALRWLSENPKG